MATKKTTKKTQTALTMTAGTEAPKLELAHSVPDSEAIEAIFSGAIQIGDVMFCAIPVKYLEVEPTYQRVQCDKVSAIAANWSHAECSAIKVNYRDGRLYIKDGQNRAIAANLAGEKTIMCVVTTGEDLDREIDMFVNQNQYVTKITPYDTFYARRHKSTDTAAHELCALFDKYGIQYESKNAGKRVNGRLTKRGPANCAPGRMNCMSLMMKEADSGHLDILDSVFETIRLMNWHTMKYAYGEIFMKAMLNAHRKCNIEKMRLRFHNVFKDQTPETIINKARVDFDKLSAGAALNAYINKILVGV